MSRSPMLPTLVVAALIATFALTACSYKNPPASRSSRPSTTSRTPAPPAEGGDAPGPSRALLRRYRSNRCTDAVAPEGSAPGRSTGFDPLKSTLSVEEASEALGFPVRVPKRWGGGRRTLGIVRADSVAVILGGRDESLEDSDHFQLNEQRGTTASMNSIPKAARSQLVTKVQVDGTEGLAHEILNTEGDGDRVPGVIIGYSELTWAKDGVDYRLMGKATVQELVALADSMP